MPVFFVPIEARSRFPHADLSLQSPPCPCPPVLCHCALRHLAPRPLACGGPASGDLGRSRASGRGESLGCVVWWKLRCFVAGLSCGPETTALGRAGLAGPGQGPATSCPAPPSRLRWCQALHRLPLRRWFLASVHSALNPLLSRCVWTRSKAGTPMGGPVLERLSDLCFFSLNIISGKARAFQSPLGPLRAFFKILFSHPLYRPGSHHYPQVKYGETEA